MADHGDSGGEEDYFPRGRADARGLDVDLLRDAHNDVLDGVRKFSGLFYSLYKLYRVYLERELDGYQNPFVSNM